LTCESLNGLVYKVYVPENDLKSDLLFDNFPDSGKTFQADKCYLHFLLLKNDLFLGLFTTVERFFVFFIITLVSLF
jgi:hypothetical protein